MSLKRRPKESIPQIQPSPKRRRLNSPSNKNKLNNTQTASYDNYSNKFKKSTTKKDDFIHSLHKISTLYGHKGCVNTVCWEKSGRHLCTGSDDQTVRVWDAFGIKYTGKTAKMLCILKGHLSNVFTAKFMYNSCVFGINNRIASGGNDADINIYDINHSPFTFKPYHKNNNQPQTTASSLFIKPFHSYHHHSRKILKICVHAAKPFEIFSCSADGTIRHFDIRRKYKTKTFLNCSQDIIIQGFGGGPRTNRGRFSQSLLYDFNTFNKHYEVYSIDINPLKPWEMVTGCGDGYIRIFDLRKHGDAACTDNKYSEINSLFKYHKNNAISCFYNFRLKFPQHCHPTHAKYNSDGSEILTTHIHDACYLYMNPTTCYDSNKSLANTANINDETAEIMQFIHEEDGNINAPPPVQVESINVNGESALGEMSSEESESEGEYGEFVEMLNFAMLSRMHNAARERVDIHNNVSDNASDDNMFYNDILDHVDALVSRRKEVLRTKCSERNFQDILFNLVSEKETKLIELHENRNDMKMLCDMNENDIMKCMKWNKNIIAKKKKNKDKDMLLPPMDSNMDIINCYDNKYYKLAYKCYVEDEKENPDVNGENVRINGMIIGEESDLHDLNENIYYFGRYVGHIHCETIKEAEFFSDNYIISGSDDKKIYIYDRLNGDIVNILVNGTNIVNNIATHPHLPIFVSSGLDSHVTLWGPIGWNNNDDKDNDIDIDYKQQEMNCTQQVVDNIFRLRHRAGFDIL